MAVADARRRLRRLLLLVLAVVAFKALEPLCASATACSPEPCSIRPRASASGPNRNSPTAAPTAITTQWAGACTTHARREGGRKTRLVSHNGVAAGATPRFALYPEYGLTIVTLINAQQADTAALDELSNAVVDAFLGAQPSAARVPRETSSDATASHGMTVPPPAGWPDTT